MENKFVKIYNWILVIFASIMILTIPSFFIKSSIYDSILMFASLPEPIILLLSIIVLIYIVVKKLDKNFLILPIIDIFGAIISITLIIIKIDLGSYLIDGLRYIIFVIFGIYLLKKK